MLQFPNCKINIGLNIIRKRQDGFHDLETIFHPVKKLCDALEGIKVDGGRMTKDENFSKIGSLGTPTISFNASGLSIAGDTSNNLCVKAYHLLKKDFHELPAVQMHLHKVVPMGAGLGGGSADGAFALRLLNEKFNLGLSQQQLVDYALQLGSDCPFFIYNKPCFATGRGEILEPVGLDLSSYLMVLINPNIHVNTGWAFGQLTPKQSTISLTEAIKQPIADWKNLIFNDFEAPVSKAHPIISEIKENLYALGAAYAAMSGSGSTLFGFFEKAKFDPTSLKKEIDMLMPEHWNWVEN